MFIFFFSGVFPSLVMCLFYDEMANQQLNSQNLNCPVSASHSFVFIWFVWHLEMCNYLVCTLGSFITENYDFCLVRTNDELNMRYLVGWMYVHIFTGEPIVGGGSSEPWVVCRQTIKLEKFTTIHPFGRSRQTECYFGDMDTTHCG